MSTDCMHEECRYWFECQLSYDLHDRKPLVFVFPAAMTTDGRIPYWWHSYVVLPVPETTHEHPGETMEDYIDEDGNWR